MATLTVGRVAMKIAGREAGKYCVVLKAPKDNFVEVTGPRVLTGVKRRRCNIEHLEPTEHQIKIDEGAEDKIVLDLLEKDGIVKKLGYKKPSPEVVKGPEMKGKKEEKPKKEEPKEEKKDGKTLTISLPKFGGKKEEPKEEKKPEKKPAKKAEKKEEKPKKKPAKKK